MMLATMTSADRTTTIPTVVGRSGDAEAEATAARLVSDAEEQKARTLEALAEEKAGLEGEVEQLRSFETDYRSRLTSYIEGQLREIRAQKRVEPPTPTA